MLLKLLPLGFSGFMLQHKFYLTYLNFLDGKHQRLNSNCDCFKVETNLSISKPENTQQNTAAPGWSTPPYMLIIQLEGLMIMLLYQCVLVLFNEKNPHRSLCDMFTQKTHLFIRTLGNTAVMLSPSSFVDCCCLVPGSCWQAESPTGQSKQSETAPAYSLTLSITIRSASMKGIRFLEERASAS